VEFVALIFVSWRAFRLHRCSRTGLRRNHQPYAYAGVVALRSSLTLPRFLGLLRWRILSKPQKDPSEEVLIILGIDG